MKQTAFLIAVLSLMQFSICRLSIAQQGNESSTAPSEKKPTFPFLSGWAEKKGIDLPSPFGITGFYTFMSRDIEITDVTVEFGGSDPKNINDFASFAVRNRLQYMLLNSMCGYFLF